MGLEGQKGCECTKTAKMKASERFLGGFLWGGEVHTLQCLGLLLDHCSALALPKIFCGGGGLFLF